MSDETYLVTGSMGCIGAWVLKHLTERGVRVVATDLATNPLRPRLLMSEDQLATIDWQTLDVTDTDAVKSLVKAEGVTRIVHLAGLQIPFCRANPPLGAAVNVLGTVNILEAARAADEFGDFELALALECVRQTQRPGGSIEHVFLVDLDPGQRPALGA